jgi:hypothetical protein
VSTGANEDISGPTPGKPDQATIELLVDRTKDGEPFFEPPVDPLNGDRYRVLASPGLATVRPAGPLWVKADITRPKALRPLMAQSKRREGRLGCLLRADGVDKVGDETGIVFNLSFCLSFSQRSRWGAMRLLFTTDA